MAHHFGYLWRTPGPAGCATEISPLKYISVAHVPGAPQKVQLSVAHLAACATDIGAPQKFCAMRHRYLKMKYFFWAVQIQVYTIVIHIYTDILLNLTGK